MYYILDVKFMGSKRKNVMLYLLLLNKKPAKIRNKRQIVK